MFVRNVTVIVLFSGKGVIGKLVTVLPLVEVVGTTRTVPLGNLIVTKVALTLVLLSGPVT